MSFDLSVIPHKNIILAVTGCIAAYKSAILVRRLKDYGFDVRVVMTQGALIHTFLDARLYAVAAGVAYFVWRKGAGQVVMGTIVVGMAVYLPLHIGLGW